MSYLQHIDCEGDLEIVHRGWKKFETCGGYCYECNADGCNKRKTIRSGTIWYDSNLPLIQHLLLLWHYVAICHRVCLLLPFFSHIFGLRT